MSIEIRRIYLRLVKYGWRLGWVEICGNIIYHPSRTRGWSNVKSNSLLGKYGIFGVIEPRTKETQ